MKGAVLLVVVRVLVVGNVGAGAVVMVGVVVVLVVVAAVVLLVMMVVLLMMITMIRIMTWEVMMRSMKDSSMSLSLVVVDVLAMALPLWTL
jgi:hypothetical protein